MHAALIRKNINEEYKTEMSRTIVYNLKNMTQKLIIGDIA